MKFLINLIFSIFLYHLIKYYYIIIFQIKMSKYRVLLILFLIFMVLAFSFKYNKQYKNISNPNLEKSKFNDFLPSFNSSYKNNITSVYDELFNSRQLFISDINLSKKYIHFIRNIIKKKNNVYEEKISNNQHNEIRFNLNLNKTENEEKYNYKSFGKLCVEEKLINSTKILNYTPIISVILPSFNKSSVIMKSIRSIQNQSFKDIEIIIVDDCSTDNSSIYFKYLLETDPRIRIFTHLRNMGVWRARLNGFLYSRGKYIIHFDTGDLYSDPFVLEDAYNLIEKYKLDSIKMMFRLIYNYSEIEHSKIPFQINSFYTKIVYKPQNIKKYNEEIFSTWGNIWTRLTRSNIISKGLKLLDSKILNIYKNLWEDCWWNRLIDEASSSFLIVNRYAYLYFKDGNGEGDINIETNEKKNKIIHEFINFLYFDLKFLPKRDNKNSIINKLYQYTKHKTINLKFFISKFEILNNLLLLLIQDPFVSNTKKVFLKRLLNESLKKEKKF